MPKPNIDLEPPMPEMSYRIRWPDHTETDCYSPSLVIRDFFDPGAEYALQDFLHRLREASTIAAERVRVKYGFPCQRALAQLQAIETQALRFKDQAQARVAMESFSFDH
jgi:uncharacterized repeat protein (TIGR04042 family)